MSKAQALSASIATPYPPACMDHQNNHWLELFGDFGYNAASQLGPRGGP
jgi:hypothetical protein